MNPPELVGKAAIDPNDDPIFQSPFLRPVRTSLTHRESYCLMPYANRQGKVEWLWNSRDGVTPFTIDEDMFHVQWNLDVFCPFFVPPIGMRIFADLTHAKAMEYARKRVARYWNDGSYPFSEHPSFKNMGQEEAARHIAASMMVPKGQPDIVVVDETLQALFTRRARALNHSIV